VTRVQTCALPICLEGGRGGAHGVVGMAGLLGEFADRSQIGRASCRERV